MGQAAHDLAALLVWLRGRSDAPVGLLGMSLGGYVAALMAGLTSDLAFVVPVVAPVCFGDLAFRFMSSSTRHGRPRAGLDRDELRAAYRVHSPLAHAPRVRHERLFILAAHGDRVVPSEHPRWLEAHWGRPRTTWFTGGHLAPFGRRTVRAELRRFLHDVGVV
jgi:dipeptidyl aminopeptidase/acylaminoacyl peptidase